VFVVAPTRIALAAILLGERCAQHRDIAESARFTSIEVAADGFPHFDKNGYVATSRERSAPRRASTGARVTVRFSRRAPLPADTDIRVRYDIAENGGLRGILGIPQLTHTTSHPGEGAAYHYRLSHWIPAPSVMQFVKV
jgi:hypothetical protein